MSGKKSEVGGVHIDDIAIEEPAGGSVLLGDAITVPTIVVLVRYFG